MLDLASHLTLTVATVRIQEKIVHICNFYVNVRPLQKKAQLYGSLYTEEPQYHDILRYFKATG